MTTVREIMRSARTCTAGASLAVASRLLRNEALESMPVLLGDRLIGQINYVDIVDAAAQGLNPKKVRVEELVSGAPALRTETDAAAAMEQLAQAGASGAPVVDDEGRVLGVVTERDLMEANFSVPDRAMRAVSGAQLTKQTSPTTTRSAEVRERTGIGHRTAHTVVRRTLVALSLVIAAMALTVFAILAWDGDAVPLASILAAPLGVGLTLAFLSRMCSGKQGHGSV
ncbi:CBS domain-containing protein [Streptomyces sp. NPDC005486]|uniref:CBS domain-containing protein n=1 Tax=Streptomyces sp. NPDC005486 TaxID=3155345 RepID=UPI0033AE692C